ncbi:Ig-like domain-containing protein [Paenibacillus caui]|uniref:Ig-like domain-containing protein n=1 Tax=Paenibacillus caui TaxID=2873927 RepID=UPI001CA92942|nr:Ig-like domain-containing protein [Paenibacillus caui]
MSNTSYSTKENSFNMKVNQGGEKKVMKKILSVALSTAMAFSMFASVAFGADATLTPDQKFDALKAQGIVSGLPGGLAHLEKTLTRAELAKIITKSLGLKEVTGVYTYKDKNYGAKHWAAPFIEAVTAAGIMKGSTVNGKQFFNPNGNVTAQELAIVLTRALKLEVPTTGIDNKASAWAQGEVQAAINKGLLEASLNWQANATRSQAVVAAYAIFDESQGPKVVSAVAQNPTSVLVTFDDKSTTTVTLTTPLVANTPTEITFTYKEKQYKTTVTLENAQVTSVAATNLKDVQIKFNRVVDLKVASFKVTDASGAVVYNSAETDPVLSSDETTVTLTTPGQLTQNGYYTVSFNGVYVDGTEFAPYATTFQVSDKTVPTLSSIKAITKDTTTNKVNVTFSEYVNFDMVKIGDTVATPTGSGKSWTLTLPTSALEAGKDYTVTVNGLRDLAGNYAANPSTFTVSIVRDNTAPTYTLVPVNPSQFDVVFNEDMSSTVPVDGIVVKNSAGAILTQSGLAKLQDDGKTFRVSLASSPITSGNTTAALSVTIQGLTDLAGNAVTTATNSVTLAKETVAPELTNVRLLPYNNKQIEATFSESVTGVESGDFIVTDPNGDKVDVASVTYSGTYASVVTLNVAGLSVNGTYKVASIVNSVKDTSGNGNVAKVLTFNYNGAASASPVTATISAYGETTTDGFTSANRVYRVDFDQNVVFGFDASTGNYKDGAVNNPAYYTINGLALPTGAQVKLPVDTSKGVKNVIVDLSKVADADLPSAVVNGGEVVLAVSNVKSTGGATIQFTSKNVTVADVTKPSVTAAYLSGDVSDNSLKLTVQLSENVTFATYAGDAFTLTVDGKTYKLSNPVYASNGTNKSQVVFDVASAGLDVNKGAKLSVAAESDAVQDAAKNNLSKTSSDITVVNYGTN